MYRMKTPWTCELPSSTKLKVTVLNASLKRRPEISNTEEVAALVVKSMGTACQIDAEIVRLADLNIELGLGFRMSDHLKNQATPAMAQNMARNLVYYAQLLKKHPLTETQGGA
jgi:hypothetical protein